MRGRNTNNRRGPNPLTRNYESNGPDVKIRGSAQQVAEKYMTLARDAQSSGDRVMAENYLQHAEHYNRIIAAAQAQQAQNAADDQDDDGEGYDDDFGPVGGDQPQARSDDNAGNNGNGGNGGNGNGGNRRNDQQPRDHQPRDHQPRQGGEHRQRPPRNDHQQQRPHRVSPPVEDHGSAPQPVIEGTPAEVALEESQTPTSNEAPVRRRRRAAVPTSAPASASAPVASSAPAVSESSEQPPAVESTSAAPVEEKKVRRPRRVRSAETEGDTSGNTGSDEGDAPKDLLAVQAD